MQELIWLLLPVAAASGWYAARHSKGKRAGTGSILGSEYLKGLNYLLNEQPDKAIDVFIRMLEVNSDTVETHLALGNLFRRRGEVDRAIRIHQNLIARQTLTPEQRSNALLELGQDYMRAGLLDRAEGLFQELDRDRTHTPTVLPLLLAIYQQEKDWDNAIEIAGRMNGIGEQQAGSVIAHFYCEKAEEALARGEGTRAVEFLDTAVSHDSHCARASIMRGDIARGEGRYQAALDAYGKVEDQDIELLPEVLVSMYTCYTALDCPDRMIDYLERLVGRDTGISPVLVLADILSKERGDAAAADFIADELGKRPSVRGLSRFIELNLSRSEGAARENLLTLKNLTDQLLEGKPVYKCRDCGFFGKTIHWQCPGCKHWNTVKPIHGVEGE